MKIRTLEELALLRPGWKTAGRKVVWTNGCFDILHVGHLRSLRDAKALGDILIVGLNSDSSVRTNKGAGRPIVPQDERAELLAALEPVDYVAIFEELDPVAAIQLLQPDIHCKGAEYADGRRPVPERDTVLAYGGEIRYLPIHEGHSTTHLIEELRASQQ